MRHCAQPGCQAEVIAPRLLCGFHYATLPATVQVNLRGLLMNGNHDSARIVLHDYFAQFVKESHDREQH